jgi:ribonucleoside-diphosphate reductase subunit M2
MMYNLPSSFLGGDTHFKSEISGMGTLSPGGTPSPSPQEVSSDENVSENSIYSFFPVKYDGLAELYQSLKRTTWFPHEVNLAVDALQWQSLDRDIVHFMSRFLFFFAQFDGIVNENLFDNFRSETSHIKEARWFYAVQAFNETIHGEMYGLTIEAVIKEPKEKHKAFNAIHNYPSIKAIKLWIDLYMDNKKPLEERILAFACIEGMIFSGAFAAIYWIKRKKLLPGITKANEWIARDEGIHTQFAVCLYRTLLSRGDVKQLSQNQIDMIIGGAIHVSDIFLEEAFTKDERKMSFPGMDHESLMGYVKVTGNYWAKEFGGKELYPGLVNPLDWMAIIGLNNKSNFFETTATEYAITSSNSYDFEKIDTDY